MDRLLNSIMRFATKNQDINNDEYEIIRYGLEILLIKVIFTIFALLLGLLLNSFFECLIFTVLFSFIRTSAGGFHSKTRLQCFVCSMMMFFTVIFLIKIASVNHYISLLLVLLSIISLGAICFLAPVPTENRPLDDDEIYKFKKRTRVVALVEVFIALVAYYFTYNRICLAVMLSMIFEAILLVLGLLLKKE